MDYEFQFRPDPSLTVEELSMLRENILDFLRTPGGEFLQRLLTEARSEEYGLLCSTTMEPEDRDKSPIHCGRLNILDAIADGGLGVTDALEEIIRKKMDDEERDK